MSRRVVVTGATGLLGRAVVSALRECGSSITAIDLTEAEDLPVDDFLVGSAGAAELVREAMRGADAVVHLAAIPAPGLGTAQQVFCDNTSATFVVLEEAASAGIRHAVIASSYAVTGLPFSPHLRQPPYLPIDEEVSLQIEDPYSLSKLVDEKTAEMMWYRNGLSVVALRFPYLGSLGDSIPARARRVAADTSFAASEVWSYLDVRDAASACRRALDQQLSGFHVIGLSAPNTLSCVDSEELCERYYPAVQRRRAIPDRTALIDVSRAERLLNWTAEHTFDPTVSLEGPERW